jgi:hypothetical protein
MQVRRVVVGVAAQGAAAQAILVVVAEGLRVLGGGQRARGDGCAGAGRCPR